MVSKTLKLVTAILETIWGIPILGGILILASYWSILGIMLVLHIITLIFSVKENKGKVGSILGIVTSVVGWIPIVGMIMHIITAIFLWIGFVKDN